MGSVCWSPVAPCIIHRETGPCLQGVVGTSGGFAGSGAALRRCLPWELSAQPGATAEGPFGDALMGLVYLEPGSTRPGSQGLSTSGLEGAGMCSRMDS